MLNKWNEDEALVDFNDGTTTEYFVPIDSIQINKTANARNREKEMDRYMSQYGMSAQQKRQDKLNSILGHPNKSQI